MTSLSTSGTSTRVLELWRCGLKRRYNSSGKIIGFYQTSLIFTKSTSAREGSLNKSMSTISSDENTANESESSPKIDESTSSTIQTDAKTSKLIELVREHGYLYKRKTTKEKLMSEKTWFDISKELGVPESWCIKKWETLRQKYRYWMRKQIAKDDVSDEVKAFLKKISFVPYQKRAGTSRKCKKSSTNISVNGKQSSHSDTQTSNKDIQIESLKSNVRLDSHEVVLNLGEQNVLKLTINIDVRK